MNESHVLLGYDRRVLEPHNYHDRLGERASVYLTRVDCPYVISCDLHVLPQPTYRQCVDALNFKSYDADYYIWRNLSEMVEYYGERGNLTLAFVLRMPLDEVHRSIFLTDKVRECSVITGDQLQGWTSLGFDVVDEHLISGLSRTAIEDSKFRAQRAALLGGNLNRFHLINDVVTAEAYCDFMNDAVTEHAPFLGVEVFCLGGAPAETHQ
jgi:hypothetical protein